MVAPKVVVILGPTGSGKSALALSVAKEFKGQIIAADSRTIYKEASIGTAKPSRNDQRYVRHHLIDTIAPHQSYSAAEFKQAARKLITQIHNSGKLPVVAGGSGLYIDSLLFDYQFPAGADNVLRQELNRLPLNELVGRLRQVDPEAYGYVDLKNRRRVIRAIETAGQARFKKPELPVGYLVIGLNPNDLDERIRARAESMVKQGLKVEIKHLAHKYGWDAPFMTASGYVRLKEHLDESDESLALRLATIHRQLARKQMSWFRRNPYTRWFSDSTSATEAVKGFLEDK